MLCGRLTRHCCGSSHMLQLPGAAPPSERESNKSKQHSMHVMQDTSPEEKYGGLCSKTGSS